MSWALVPALVAAGLMTAMGVACIVRPESLRMIGVVAENPLGRSEIRVVFGAMFLALGLACIILREPIVFAVVGAAWLADFVVRLVAVIVDRVPIRDAAWVLAIAAAMGAALMSGYWAA